MQDERTHHDMAPAAPQGKALARKELVRFDGVGKSFGALKAVRDISLTVYEGEFLTLVGPSGCGKSTLLNMAAGLFPPTEGVVTYRGEPVQPYNHRVGYMTQSDHLLHWRTVARNIAIPLQIARLPKDEIRDRVDALLELVGLTGFGDNYPGELSGGMRKRCALARLLAYDPETLLFDEPFAALDAQLRLKMQMEIRSIVARLNKSVMFVTHDLDEAVALADRCVVFSGRPGTIKEILDIPLPQERDLFSIRKNPVYADLTARLWDEMAPSAGAEEN